MRTGGRLDRGCARSRVAFGICLVGAIGLLPAPAARGDTTVRANLYRGCGISDNGASFCPTPLAVGWDTAGAEHRTLLDFGSLGVPPGEFVVSAKLRGSPRTALAPGMLVGAHAVQGHWDGHADWAIRTDRADWYNLGGDFDEAPESTTNLGSCSGTCSWDLTQLVREWHGGARGNEGVILVASPDGVTSPVVEFWGAGAQAPYIEIVYDDAPPDVELEGVLYEDRATQLLPDLHDLSIAADDTGSGVDRAEIRLDGSLVFTATPDLPCDGPCDVDVDDYLLDATAFSGDHLLEVKAYDEAGNVTTIAWTANFDGQGEPFVPSEPVGTDPDGGMAGSLLGPTFALGCSFSSRAQAKGGVDLTTTSVRHGSWRDSSGRRGPETTEFLADGSYVLTRCTPSGQLIIGWWIGSVPVPDGAQAMLPLAWTLATPTGFVMTTPEYASPRDPQWVAQWRSHRAAIERAVPDPTRLLP